MTERFMHPLYGPNLKLRRAEKHLNDARASIQAFLESRPYTFALEANPKPPDFIIVVQATQLAPADDTGVIIGDFAHNARSALDLLTFQLSNLPPDDSDRRSLQFPIFDDEDRYKDHVERYLAKVKPEHIAIIEDFQPYKNHDGFDNDPLSLLHDINNVDKHRVLHVIGAIARFLGLDFGGPRLGSDIIVGSAPALSVGHKSTVNFGDGVTYTGVGDGVIVQNRTVVAKLTMPSQVNMRPKFQVTIKFDEGSGRVKGRPVMNTLTIIHDRVRKVLSKFEKIV